MKEHVKTHQSLNADVEEWNADGKYAIYENISVLGVKGIDFIYPISKQWKIDRCSVEDIKKAYQKYWKDEDFRSNAFLRYMLSFFYKKGEYDIVGRNFREMMMECEEAPDCYIDVYHERNKCEALNSYLKEQFDVERRLPKRKKKAMKFFILCVISLLLAAVIRVQNGVFKSLTSIAYLT